MADLSDSIDDLNFQAFLREPLSSESSLAAAEEIKTVPKVENRPKSPPKLWWMTSNNTASSSHLVPKKEVANVPVPESSLTWLKPKSGASDVPKSTSEQEQAAEVPQPKERTPPKTVDVEKSKEASPGVVTTSGTTDSMAEFLEKETEFKEESEKEKAKKKEDDASSDTLIDGDYAEDFTDDISDELYGASQADVKAIMQMLAKQLESVDLHELDIPDLNLPDTTVASGGSSRERSVEEILEEVEELERSTSRSSSFEKEKPDVTQIPIVQENATNPPPVSTSFPVSVPPQQTSTPKPQDTLLGPDLSLKLPLQSSDNEHLTKAKQIKFSLSNNPIGPAGDIPSFSVKFSNKDSQKITASEDSLQTKNNKKDENRLESHLNLEDLLLAEQAKYLKLQETLEKHEQDHEIQLANLKVEHEKEVFELKKHSYYLNAKVQNYEQAKQEDRNSARANSSSELKVQLLEAEVQKQEQLIVATQKENEKLCNQVKEFKEHKK